mmetsp:Transcript_118579/g.332040  ORF Transcript_118579/g.332040 Transcript_118579/m.332040 type:complete len:252 (+) Transcript_118579:484-1239(+)
MPHDLLTTAAVGLLHVAADVVAESGGLSRRLVHEIVPLKALSGRLRPGVRPPAPERRHPRCLPREHRKGGGGRRGVARPRQHRRRRDVAAQSPRRRGCGRVRRREELGRPRLGRQRLRADARGLRADDADLRAGAGVGGRRQGRDGLGRRHAGGVVLAEEEPGRLELRLRGLQLLDGAAVLGADAPQQSVEVPRASAARGCLHLLQQRVERVRGRRGGGRQRRGEERGDVFHGGGRGARRGRHARCQQHDA